MRLIILFDMLLNPSFKMTTSFANVARTQLAQVNLYSRKYFKSLGTGSLHEKKFLILSELKNSLILNFFFTNLFAKFQKLIFDVV